MSEPDHTLTDQSCPVNVTILEEGGTPTIRSTTATSTLLYLVSTTLRTSAVHYVGDPAVEMLKHS